MALSVCRAGRTLVRLYVGPSVRSVVHNSCGQDIARIMWPRMLKGSVCTLIDRRSLSSKVKRQVSRSLGLYKELWHFDPCGQDIARTMQPWLLKLRVYTSYGKRKKSIHFQGQRTNFKVTGSLHFIMVIL